MSSVPASSLIFVVIIAVWAAYLIQHWIRRRDHVATARSVDRFSEAMRVLERRQRLPRADLSVPATRSYAVALARPAHPEVVVKRAHPKVAPGQAQPPARSGRGARPATRPAARPAARRAARRSGVPRAARAAGRRRRPAVRRPASNQVRGLVLVAGALLMVAGVGLGVFTLLPWWSTLAGVGIFVAALAYVRCSVAAERRRSASPVRPPQALRPRAARPRRTARQDRQARARGARRVAAADRGRAAATSARPQPATKSPPGAAALLAVADRSRDAAPLAVADRSRAAEVYDVEAAHPRSETNGQGPLRAKATRRHTSRLTGAALVPVADLPFDGNALALEEEFEELPAVHGVV